MKDDPDEFAGRWTDLINARGIAGLGARETASEKSIVEKSVINEFKQTIFALNGILVDGVTPERPPLPDFTVRIADQKIRVELVEFIDGALVKNAKFIRSDSTHPLNKAALTFAVNKSWFSDLLLQTILKKEQRYANRDISIDALLIWNEALELEVTQIQEWLSTFEVPHLSAIRSIYFQSWYHPAYEARPTWSLVSHPKLGDVSPVGKKRG